LRDAYAADVRLGLSLTGMLGKQWGYFADLEASRNFGVLKDTSLIPGRSVGSASIGLTYRFQ
jgi:outer membrane scaffolding protein for murein synthesis (MipA/OmpV family)